MTNSNPSNANSNSTSGVPFPTSQALAGHPQQALSPQPSPSNESPPTATAGPAMVHLHPDKSVSGPITPSLSPSPSEEGQNLKTPRRTVSQAFTPLLPKKLTRNSRKISPNEEELQANKRKLKEEKRTIQLHDLFKDSIPVDEVWVADYSCALENKNKILCHGRMWVTRNFICFSSNIFGFVTREVIAFKDIQSMKKDLHALINPAIVIRGPSYLESTRETKKHFFASFVSRDYSYSKLLSVWKAARCEEDVFSSDEASPNHSPSVSPMASAVDVPSQLVQNSPSLSPSPSLKSQEEVNLPAPTTTPAATPTTPISSHASSRSALLSPRGFSNYDWLLVLALVLILSVSWLLSSTLEDLDVRLETLRQTAEKRALLFQAAKAVGSVV